MANFKTHITTSTVLGIGYGATAHLAYDVPLDQCLLATGLCSVSGMLPDLDSDNSVPLRESLAFAAVVVPMLLIDRFRDLGLSTDAMVLYTGLLYLTIRFVLGSMLKKYTRHRGMFHSIPAAIIFAEVAFLLCHAQDTWLRVFKASAVLLGVLSHLVLDEIWSIEWRLGGVHIKRSFGTALKLWDKVMWANISAYAKLALVTYIILNEPAWMNTSPRRPDPPNLVGSPSSGKEEPRSAKSPPLRLFK